MFHIRSNRNKNDIKCSVRPGQPHFNDRFSNGNAIWTAYPAKAFASVFIQSKKLAAVPFFINESEKLIYRLQGQEVSFKQEMKPLEN